MKRLLLLTALLVAGATVLGVPLSAQEGRSKRVRFAPGTSGTTIRSAVVRGTTDRYFVEARAGQTMHAHITSVENNAVFAVYQASTSHSGTPISQPERTRWSGVLPTSGDYAIVVSGTRGNATYSLTLSIR